MKNRIFLFALLLIALSAVATAGISHYSQTESAFAATTCPSYYKLVGEDCVPMSDAELCGGSNEHRVGDQCWCDSGYGRVNGVGACVPLSSGCPANSHWTGEQCICDTGYTAKNDACVVVQTCQPYYKLEGENCVPMTASEICPTANSHQSGNQCVCDSGYMAKNGACVTVSVSERCGTEHAHLEGDVCHCDKGYGTIKGGTQCVSASAYCSSHNAHYDASINDCKCNEGYTENEAESDCIAVPVESKPTPPPTPTITEVDAEQDAITPPDLIEVMTNLKSVQPLIDVSLKGSTKAEIQTVTKQEESIASYSEEGNAEVELSLTVEQNMNLAKEIIKENVEADLKKWETKVEIAEIAGDVKNKQDKDKFEQLKKQEDGIMQQIKDNQEALDVMQRQNVALIMSTEDYAPGLVLDAKQQSMVQRDFMKDGHGDVQEARVYAAQAISAQYKLLEKLKNNLRATKDQKRSLLDIPPKPDLDKELAKIDINWYK